MIKFENVSKVIPLKTRQLEILKDISFNLESSKVSILFGKSGSGKTTLLHLLAGLDTPSSGICYINKNPISKLSVDDRASFRLNNIGMVYQFFNLLPNLTILENIKLPLILAGKAKKQSNIDDICTYLGIENIINQFPGECSGGELQRASFARAMINDPSIIIADEPTGNLDSENREKMMRLIKNLSEDFNISFLIATHDKLFTQIASTVITLVDGELQS